MRGGYIELDKFRDEEWTPALEAAGVAHRRLYDCGTPCAPGRSSALWLIDLAQIMGTRRHVEDTYFRWMKRTDDQLRSMFDAYDAAVTG